MAMIALDQIPDSAKARFWALVDKRTPIECWPFKKITPKAKGYGSFYANGLQAPATHFALWLDGRPRPSAAHRACHRCDNPPCVNPHHLWWGTQGDNIRDASRKGRLSSKGKGVYVKHMALLSMSDEAIYAKAIELKVSPAFLKMKKARIIEAYKRNGVV